jgi:hypothetical protein
MSIRLILTLFFIFLFALLAASRIDQLIPGVWTLELVSGWALDYHTPSTPSPWPVPAWTTSGFGPCR